MFRVPSVHGPAKTIAGEVKWRRRGLGSFPRIFTENFLGMFGKSIDGDQTEAFAESLSLIGKLFEIYFVRLIGTPNQNSK